MGCYDSAPREGCYQGFGFRLRSHPANLQVWFPPFPSEGTGARHTCPAQARQGLSAPRCASQTSFHPPTHPQVVLTCPVRRLIVTSGGRIRRIRDGCPAWISRRRRRRLSEQEGASRTWSAVAASSIRDAGRMGTRQYVPAFAMATDTYPRVGTGPLFVERRVRGRQ